MILVAAQCGSEEKIEMDDSFESSDFNPLQRYSGSNQNNVLTIPSSEDKNDEHDEHQSAVCEAGESEYAIISDYSAIQSPIATLQETETPILESEVGNEAQSLMSKVETKEDNPDFSRKDQTISGIVGLKTCIEMKASQGIQGIETIEALTNVIDPKDQTQKQDQNEELKIVVDSGSTERIGMIEEKGLPSIPPSMYPPYTPMINPLHTVLSDKSLKVDEYDQPIYNESDNLSAESSPQDLPFKLRLRVALGSLTIDKWRGAHKSKTSYFLLSLRLLFMIYTLCILILSCSSSPASMVFSAFNIWSWIIMLLWLILSLYASIKKPNMTFGLSSAGIILYLFFATYSLCTPIPLILKLVGSNTLFDIKSWILELSLGSFGLIVLLFELSFNQINLSNALMPVFIAGNSLIWAILFGINASIYGNVGNAFPWMSSHIIPGAICVGVESKMDKEIDLRRSLSSEEKSPKVPLQHFPSEPLLRHMRRLSQSVFQPKVISPAEAPKLTLQLEDYELGTCIGQGSSAFVYIAKYLPTGTQVSIKILELDKFERNHIDELRREIQIMTLSKHINLLPVYGSFVNGSKLYIVTPLLLCGSALDIMKTAHKDGFEEVVIATLLKQALQGLQYLHKTGLIHRDVKAGNLLVDKDGLVQLADFGVSSSLMESGERKGTRKTFVGTPSWMSPEVMEQCGYDYKADIWSFGITAIELATGHAPYAKYSPMKILMMTLQNNPPTLDRNNCKHKFSKTFKDMIDSCLQKDPTKRPTAEKLLNHPFFKQAKKPSYLCGAILDSLPPLELRHRKLSKADKVKVIGERPVMGPEHKIISWDFPDDFDDDTTPLGNNNALISKLEQIEKRGTSIRFTLPTEDDEEKTSSTSQNLSSIDSASLSLITTNSASGIDRTVQSSQPAKQKGRFSIVEGNSPSDSSAVSLNTSESKEENTATPASTLERKMGRFAIHTSPRLADTRSSESSMIDLSKNNSCSDVTVKSASRFKKASDDQVASPDISTVAKEFPNGDTRGRFRVSSIESSDKMVIPGVDSELLSLLMQDPIAGISHLSPEDKFSHILDHCNKQRGLIEQLLSIIKKNNGESNSS